MVPIYESDVAEERWSEAEWKHYELWEKVELRLLRQRRLWILGTILVFLLLSSVPIVLDRRPHWTALAANRTLAQEINGLKRGASLTGAAHRIRFNRIPELSYVIETASQCGSAEWKSLAERTLPGADRLMLVSEEQGIALGYERLLASFCYDPLSGSGAAGRAVGFGIVPVKDLTSGRSDRMSLLVLSGPSAELAFE